MKKEVVRQAVVFADEIDFKKTIEEHQMMKESLERIAKKDRNPDRCVENYELQSCISIAEEVLEEMEAIKG